jgi:hypothetical protein
MDSKDGERSVLTLEMRIVLSELSEEIEFLSDESEVIESEEILVRLLSFESKEDSTKPETKELSESEEGVSRGCSG